MNKRKKIQFISFCYLVLQLVFSFKAVSSNNQKSEPDLHFSLRGNGMQYRENKGQVIDMAGCLRPDVLYVGDGGDAKIYLRKTGWSYVVDNMSMLVKKINWDSLDNESSRSSLQTLKAHRLDIDFVNGNPSPIIVNEDELEGHLNFYYPHCPDGVMHVKEFNKVLYKDVYKNIDVLFYGNKSDGMKYDLIIRPGGDPNQIKLKYSGADRVEITNGELRIKNSLGEIVEWMPKVYQNIEGEIVDVKMSYQLNEDVLSFVCSDYQTNYSLIIDPSTWSTYYGGTDTEYAISITTDNTGNVIFTGSTASLDFPVSPGAFQTQNNWTWSGYWGNAFAVKMDANGIRQFATFYGGRFGDFGTGVATDASDNICISGLAFSNNFPTGSAVGYNIHQSVRGGGADAFLIKFDPLGTRLFSTYYGGSITDYARDVATDGVNIYLYGRSASPDYIATPLAFQTIESGPTDVFVAKFDAFGNCIWGTYVGGSGDEYTCGGITLDSFNDIYIGGTTNSTDFPVSGGHQMLYGGGTNDAFLFKLDPSGNRVWGTYYGGLAEEWGSAVSCDNLGNVFLGGRTQSLTAISTPGAFQQNLSGTYINVFVVKFNSAGTRQWGTYIGNDFNYCAGLACDAYNNVVVGGNAVNGLPVTSCAYQTSRAGTNWNQFITTLNPSGQVICSGYYGSTTPMTTSGNFVSEGDGGCIAVHGGSVYLVASVLNFPITTGAYQTSIAGDYDVGLAKMCINRCGLGDNPIAVSLNANNTNVCSGNTVQWYGSNTCDNSNTNYYWSFPGATQTTSTDINPTTVYNTAGVYSATLIVVTPCGTDTIERLNYITVNTVSVTSVVTDINCNGNSNGMASVSATGGNMPYSYIWNNGNTNSTITNQPAGVYTVTVSDVNSCLTTNTITINQPQPLTITTNSVNSTCGLSNGAAAVNVSGGTSAYTYLWNNNSVSSSITNILSGVYSVTVTDNNGCIQTNTFTISTTSNPTVTISNSVNVSCYNGNNGSAHAIASSGTSNYTYSWSNNSTKDSITNLTAGNYSVTVTDSLGCSSVASVIINQPAAINISLNTTDNHCSASDGSVSALTSGGTSPYSYQWSNANANSTISNLPGGLYSLTLTDNNGCVSTQTVMVNTINTANISAGNDTTVQRGQILQLNSVASGGGVINYIWSPAIGLSCTNCPSPTVNIDLAVTYTVVITDSNGCTAMDDITVNIIDPCNLDNVFIPNAFSPNGDGQNDFECLLGLTGTCIKELDFIIYDRWGKKVFETHDGDTCWDGTFKGKLLEPEVFVYKLNIFFSNMEPLTRSGNISLVR